MWVSEFLDFCAQESIPLDFLSTHHYCADVAIEMGKFTDDIRWRGQKSMRADIVQVV